MAGNDSWINENDTSTNAAVVSLLERYHYAALILLTIPAATIFGNVLVVLSVVREKSLQSVTNYFIVSLAVADFLVALCVMPFAIYQLMQKEKTWGASQLLCNVFITSDVWASTASILNLVVISIDRHFAITYPIAYTKYGRNTKRAVLAIGFAWIASFLIALPIMLGINVDDSKTTVEPDGTIRDCNFTNPIYIIVSSTLSFFLPCCIMSVIYMVILKRLHRREKMKKRGRIPASYSRGGEKHDSVSTTHLTALFGGAILAKEMGRRLHDRATEDMTCSSTYQTSDSSDDDDDDYDTTASSASPFASSSALAEAAAVRGRQRLISPASADLAPPHWNSSTTPDRTLVLPAKSPPHHQGSSSTTPFLLKPTLQKHNSSNNGQHKKHTSGHQQHKRKRSSVRRQSRLQEEEEEEQVEKEKAVKVDETVVVEEEGTVAAVQLESLSARTLTSAQAESLPTTRRSLSGDLNSFSEELFGELFPFIDAQSRQGSQRRSTTSNKGLTRRKKRTKAPMINLVTLENFRTSQNSMRLSGTEGAISAAPSPLSADCRKVTSASAPPQSKSQQSRRHRRLRNSVAKASDELWKRLTGFHIRSFKPNTSKHLRKKAEKRIRKERKATVTLAIVLVVFLVCWVPFFAVHVANSVLTLNEEGEVSFGLFLALTWLGYMNSFMNPLIYTTFNPEYRKAFKKILTCSSGQTRQQQRRVY